MLFVLSLEILANKRNRLYIDKAHVGEGLLLESLLPEGLELNVLDG